MVTQRHQIRIRKRGRGRQIVLHEGWSNYDHCQLRLDELEEKYDRKHYEVEYRDVQLSGTFK